MTGPVSLAMKFPLTAIDNSKVSGKENERGKALTMRKEGKNETANNLEDRGQSFSNTKSGIILGART